MLLPKLSRLGFQNQNLEAFKETELMSGLLGVGVEKVKTVNLYVLKFHKWCGSENR